MISLVHLSINKYSFDFKDGADEDIEYEYDANGNMTKDLNHGICNIEYNCINLPSRVDFLDSSKVLYTYDAKGTKLRTDYYINPMSAVAPQTTNEQCASSATNLKHTWTDYCGNFIYENDTLKQTLIEGGYISYEYPQNTTVTSISQLAPTYHFYVQDHLGNNRLVVDESGKIEQINHYYPFGGLMGESKNISSNQRYKYNGKEFDRMHGLDWYDYGARFHDPATVRWFSVDQLAEKYRETSPYVYCANDPVNKFDPDGMEVKPGDFFLTLDEAAKDFGIYINAISIKENREYATSFYTMVSSDGKKGFSYTEPIKGSEAGAVAKTNISRDAKGNVTATNKTTKEKAVATAHTHGSYNKDYGIGNDVFSGLKELIGQDKAEERKNLNDKTKDIGSSNSSRLQDYLVTPNGTLQNYNPSTGIIRIVSENMPKDEKDNKTLKDIKDYYGQK